MSGYPATAEALPPAPRSPYRLPEPRRGEVTARIVVGNDHHLLLDALAQTLRMVDDFEVVGVACGGAEVVPAVLRSNPTVVVLGAPGSGSSGLSLAAEVHGRRPSVGIVMVAPTPTRALVDDAFRTGVLSVVPMDATLHHLIRTIRGVSGGCMTVYPDLQPTSGEACGLSDRERDVLRLTWTGASVREIADELYLAPGSVRNVTSAAIRKLGGRNRYDAARIARERGWV